MDKHLILVALAILIPGLLFVALHWPHGIHKTFSQHVALKRASILYYFALFALVLPIIFIFFKNYLIPELALSNVVLLLVGLSSLAQIGCTLVPELGGLKAIIHQIFAGVSALLLIAVLMLISKSNSISAFDRVSIFVCMAMMTTIIGFVIFWKKTKLPALLLQASYFSLFFVGVLIATY